MIQINKKNKVIAVLLAISIVFSAVAFYTSLTYPTYKNNSLEQLVDSQQQLLNSQQQWLGTVSNSTLQLYDMYDNLQSQISSFRNINTSQGSPSLPISSEVPDFRILFVNGNINAIGFNLTASYCDIQAYNGCIVLFSLSNFTLKYSYQLGNYSYLMIVDGCNVTTSFSGALNFTKVGSEAMTSFENIFKANMSVDNFFVYLNNAASFSAQHLEMLYIDQNHWLFNATNCELSIGGAAIEFNGNLLMVSISLPLEGS